MSFKRANEAYQTTINETTPMIDSIIQLLNEMGKVIVKTQVTIIQDQSADVSKPLKNLQQVLFDLMGVVNQQTREGKRMMVLYSLLNRNLIKVQLHKRYELLPGIQQIVGDLEQAWKDAREVKLRRSSATDRF